MAGRLLLLANSEGNRNLHGERARTKLGGHPRKSQLRDLFRCVLVEILVSARSWLPTTSVNFPSAPMRNCICAVPPAPSARARAGYSVSARISLPSRRATSSAKRESTSLSSVFFRFGAYGNGATATGSLIDGPACGRTGPGTAGAPGADGTVGVGGRFDCGLDFRLRPRLRRSRRRRCGSGLRARLHLRLLRRRVGKRRCWPRFAARWLDARLCTRHRSRVRSRLWFSFRARALGTRLGRRVCARCGHGRIGTRNFRNDWALSR